MNKYISIALAATAALLCGCAKNATEDSASTYKRVPVEYHLSIADLDDALTRSETALFPEAENWIFDFYWVQFNSRGVSVGTEHERTTIAPDKGDMVVSGTLWLWDVPGTSTVCFVANILPKDGNYGDDPRWFNTDIYGVQNPYITDNLTSFQGMKFDMTQRILAAENGTLKHTPMCGYWEGSAEGSSETSMTQVSATLGRMIVRMNVNIKNSTGSTINSVQLKDVASKAYIYPQVNGNPLDASADYMDLAANSVSIADGASQTLYFYTAPNFCTGGGKQTKLFFSTASGKSGSMPLGSDFDLEDLADSDMNLYMNTIYTYNIEVK